MTARTTAIDHDDTIPRTESWLDDSCSSQNLIVRELAVTSSGDVIGVIGSARTADRLRGPERDRPFGNSIVDIFWDKTKVLQRLPSNVFPVPAAQARWLCSVSLDELAIGLAIGLLRLPLLLVAMLIGAQALFASQLGARLGARLGELVRAGAERVAGALLVLLGVAFVLLRLTGHSI